MCETLFAFRIGAVDLPPGQDAHRGPELVYDVTNHYPRGHVPSHTLVSEDSVEIMELEAFEGGEGAQNDVQQQERPQISLQKVYYMCSGCRPVIGNT